MMKKALTVLIAISTLSTAPLMAKDFDVSITNLTNAVYFTPLLVSAHPSTTSVFEEGMVASDNLQAMAEGGDISGLNSALTAVSADIVENPAAGLLAPPGKRHGKFYLKSR